MLIDYTLPTLFCEPEFMPPDGARRAYRSRSGMGVSHGTAVLILMMPLHQDTHAIWFLGHIYPPV